MQGLQMESFPHNLDTAIFTVQSQTSENDKKSLLVLQKIVRENVPEYVYFEVGSHLGGTLVPHLADPHCQHVFSVDKRPASQLDERGIIFDYEDNSTQRMLATLEAHLPASAFVKLTTVDADVSEIDAVHIQLKVDFAFIDAEHTNVAVFKDFVGTHRFLDASFLAAFHDANLVCDGLQNIECFLQHQGVAFQSFFLPDVVYVIAAGGFIGKASEPLQRLSIDREHFIHDSRVQRWKAVARNAGSIKGNAIGHRK
jgi:hypothetical protein